MKTSIIIKHQRKHFSGNLLRGFFFSISYRTEAAVGEYLNVSNESSGQSGPDLPWTTSINQITLGMQSFWAGVILILEQLPVVSCGNSSRVYYGSKRPPGTVKRRLARISSACSVCLQRATCSRLDSCSVAVPRLHLNLTQAEWGIQLTCPCMTVRHTYWIPWVFLLV